MPVRAAPLELATLDTPGLETCAVFVGEDERPARGLAGLVDWRLCGRLSRLVEAGVYQGAEGEDLLTPLEAGLPLRRLFAFGLGPLAQVTPERFASAAARAARALAKAGVSSAIVGLPQAPAASVAAPLLLQALEPLREAQVVVAGDDKVLGAALAERRR